MDTKKTTRKIGYYFINPNDGRDPSTIIDAIDSIMKKSKTERKEFKNENVFYYMSERTTLGNNRNFLNITFKIGEIGFRPPLIDSNTLDERDNEKTMYEGEGKKNHFVLKIENNKIFLVAEEFRSGVTISMFIRYINNFAKEFDLKPRLFFSYEICISDDFEKELENFKRVNQLEIYYDRKILGSEAFNFADNNRTKIGSFKTVVNAAKNESLGDVAKNLGNSIIGRSTKINNFRIKGTDDYGSQLKIEWLNIKKSENIIAVKSTDTGEIISENIFKELNNKLHDFS